MESLRILTNPTVRLVGRQQVDDAELAAFLRDEGADGWETEADEAAQVLAEVAGRLCYKSYARPRPGGNEAYLGRILEAGHGSVLEHAVYNFIVTGVSRSFSHELVRHRAGFSYSQRSQRFCDETEGAFVVPPALRVEVATAKDWARSRDPLVGIDDDHFYSDVMREFVEESGGDELLDPAIEAGMVWLCSVEDSQVAYRDLTRYLINRNAGRPDLRFLETITPSDSGARKQAREAGRSVLPNATETQIFVTANARALRHFIEARGGVEADAEIRRVAVWMLRILRDEAPNLFGDYHVRVLDSGHEAVGMSPHRKV